MVGIVSCVDTVNPRLGTKIINDAFQSGEVGAQGTPSCNYSSLASQNEICNLFEPIAMTSKHPEHTIPENSTLSLSDEEEEDRHQPCNVSQILVNLYNRGE